MTIHKLFSFDSIPSSFRFSLALMFALLVSVGYATEAQAHCDAMDGPVVIEAQAALETGTLAPVLKWVRAEDEAEVRRAFEQTLTVREGGPEARELADRYFFETVVRLHRASEGAPYTGLKPAGTGGNDAIDAADAALETGSAGAFINGLLDELEANLRDRYEHALEARAHAGESVEAGRAYVAAYVEFIHYAEHLHEITTDAHTSVASDNAPSAHESAH